jgi:integrase
LCQIAVDLSAASLCLSDLRPISQSLFDQPEYPRFDAARVRQLCASLASQGGNSMARKVGQIIARGDRRWLIRVYLGRDHETRSVTITTELNGKWCFSDTKRLRSRRPIRLQNWIVSLLHDLHTKVGAQDFYPEARDLIFTTPSGQPISADNLAKHFRSIIDLAGIPRLRLYDLRHSAATIALAAGVSPKVVSEQLVHASTAFPLDTYAHVQPHMQDEAAARVEALLFGAAA